LERDIPEKFHYWKHKGAKAREIRDALVAEEIVTEDTVGLVNGEIRLLKKKALVKGESGEWEEVRTDKQARVVDYTLSRQSFRGPVQVRAGFSKLFWWLVLDKVGARGVRAWRLQTDPLSGEERISAIVPPSGTTTDKELLTLEGSQEPGSRFNDTKNTPSEVAIIGRGKVELLDEQPGFLKVRFRSGPLKGIRILEQEDGSDIWEFRPSSVPGQATKAIPERGGVQIWDPDKKNPDADRGMLKPLAEFAPMKPREGFFDPEEIDDKWATPEVLKGGVAVEPKWNGLRTVAQSDGKRELIYFEDAKDDRAKILPSVTADLKKLREKIGPFILDAELADLDPD
jgi:hypothetical protein